MKSQLLKSDLLLLLTGLIWGFAFVAQRIGMDHVGPFAFNGIRFALGSISLIPLILFIKRKSRLESGTPEALHPIKLILSGGLTGLVLFLGASLQQVGLVYTTAGKAGFITGLYVVIVPILWLFRGRKSDSGTWIGATLAAI
ncbi:MAG: DMT family transporter, partial [SAR324 cluster bacterium]|nr:DMT family transporter [SAR324 cluster bacterium]